MSENLDVWKIECLKVWMSGNVWKFECWKCLESLNVSKFECLKVWMSGGLKSGCLKVCMPESLDVAKFECLNVWVFQNSGFIFSISNFQIWRMSRTKASLSHLELSKFEGRLPQKLRFYIFKFHNLKDISHKSFVFKVWTLGIWRKSRAKASSSKLEQVEFERGLTRKLW